jgi:hypothetical protein
VLFAGTGGEKEPEPWLVNEAEDDQPLEDLTEQVPGLDKGKDKLQPTVCVPPPGLQSVTG